MSLMPPKNSGRAAFIGGDVRFVAAQHGAPRRREVRQRERVGRRPGRHQEHRDLALKNLGECRSTRLVQSSRP